MTDALLDGRRRLIDPIDRVSEILFGLIMAVNYRRFPLGCRIRAPNRACHDGGCLNLAWGLVDAVMYLVRALTQRTRNLALARRMADSELEDARRLLAQSLPSEIASLTGPEALEGMRRRLLDWPLASRATLGRDDYMAAVGVFILVVVATFPVVLPFMLVRDAGPAMNISRATALAMLLLGGVALGRYAGHARAASTGLVMAAVGAVLIAAVKALGG